MRTARFILAVCIVLRCGVAQTDAWQTHRGLAEQALKDKNYDAAERERGMAYLEALKFGEGDRRITASVMEWAETFFTQRKGPDAEALYRKALDLLARTPSETESLDRARYGFARSVVMRGTTEYNHPAEAAARRIREALGVLAKINRPNVLPAASLLGNLGIVLLTDGYYSAAQKVLTRSLTLNENAVTLTFLGDAERRMGLFEAAQQHLERALTLEASGQTAAASDGTQRTSISGQRLYYLGRIYGDMGQSEIAEPVLKQALEAGTAWRAEIHCAIANSYRDRGKFADAEAFYTRALDIDRELRPREDTRIRAECLEEMGLMAFRRRDLVKADEYWREARTILERSLRPGHPALGGVLWRQAQLASERHKPGDAAALAARAVSLLEEAAGTAAPALAPVLRDLGSYRMSVGDPASAESARARATAIVPAAPAPIRPSTTAVALEVESGYWESIEGRKDATLFHAYQAAFPLGRFVAEAVRIAGKAPADAGLPANAPCPAEFDAVPAAQFGACFSFWSRAGFAPASLALYQQGATVLATGSFQKMPARLLTTMLSLEEQIQAVDLYAARKYRPDIVSVLQGQGGPRFTTTWAPAAGAFYTAMETSVEAARSELAAQAAKGLVNTVAVPVDGTRYLMSWAEPEGSKESRTFLNLTQAESRDVFNTQRTDHAIYHRWVSGPANNRRITEIWVRRPGIAWYVQGPMEHGAFQTARVLYEARGYALAAVEANGPDVFAVWWRTWD